MPATEKTWRDQARTHVVFGITALVMLVATIWMLAKDHNREWRQWQLDDRAKERWTVEAQFAQADADTAAELARLRQELTAAQSSPVETQMVERFKKLVQGQDAQLKKQGIAEKPADFSDLDAAMKVLEEAFAAKSDAIDEARPKVITELNEFAHEAKRRENTWLTKKKLVAADQTAAVSARGIAIGEGRPTEEVERKIQEYADSLVEIDAYLADAKDYRIALETIVKEIQATELDLEKRIATIETDLNRLREKAGLEADRLHEPHE